MKRENIILKSVAPMVKTELAKSPRWGKFCNKLYDLRMFWTKKLLKWYFSLFNIIFLVGWYKFSAPMLLISAATYPSFTSGNISKFDYKWYQLRCDDILNVYTIIKHKGSHPMSECNILLFDIKKQKWKTRRTSLSVVLVFYSKTMKGKVDWLR